MNLSKDEMKMLRSIKVDLLDVLGMLEIAIAVNCKSTGSVIKILSDKGVIDPDDFTEELVAGVSIAATKEAQELMEVHFMAKLRQTMAKAKLAKWKI